MRSNSTSLENTLAPILKESESLNFATHRIEHLIDADGRHHLELPKSFPLALNLFHMKAGAVSRQLTWHERLEVLMPLDGPLRERIGEEVALLHPGDMLIIDHLRPHQVLDSPLLNTRVIVVSFAPECVCTASSPSADQALLRPFFPPSPHGSAILRASSPWAAEAHGAIHRLLETMTQHRHSQPKARAKAWLLVLLSSLLEEFRGCKRNEASVSRLRLAAARVRPVLDQLMKHPGKRLTPEEAGRLCHLSRAQFNRLFKLVTGHSLGNYLNQCRLNDALALLESPNKTIAEIALELGYADQSHFVRRFRSQFGCAPLHYRQRCRSAIK